MENFESKLKVALNQDFGAELENLMYKYPHSQVYTALKMAVKNLKNGNFATYNIRSDWDKYGNGYGPQHYKDFAKELKELCIKYGIMTQDGRFK